MRLTRRGWIGASAALAGFPLAATGARATTAAPRRAGFPVGVFQIRARGAGHDYSAALTALRDYAVAELAAWGLPGMTLSVTDLDGFSAVLALGWADVDRHTPLDPGHYFQIGSISKSFIALTLLALSDEGRIDLDAPVARYLPDLPLPAETITVAQLLSHTAGLPDGAPMFPRTPDGRLWCGFKPGAAFSYSNIGYTLLGRVIEQASGLPHAAAVTKYVRARLGLTDMAPTIAQADRTRFATGYWPWDYTAASALPGARLSFASWDEEDNPAGCIGATSEQMAAYLRSLMRIGRGEGSGVLSATAARRFTAPVIATGDFGPGAHYACGVAISPLDGAPALHHTGGMMSFSSSFHADPAVGVGCFASVNARSGGYRPRQTTAFAVRLMRAARAGTALPAPPDPLASLRFKDPAPYLGHFVGDARDLTLEAAADGIVVRAGGVSARVIPQGPDRLATDHPALASHGLDAVRENGKIVGYWWGEALYGRDAPRATPPPAAALRALTGTYLDRDPWIGGIEFLARGDALVAEGGGRFIDRGGWWSAEKDVGGLERVRFDATIGGRAFRANVSGQDLWRVEV